MARQKRFNDSMEYNLLHDSIDDMRIDKKKKNVAFTFIPEFSEQPMITTSQSATTATNTQIATIYTKPKIIINKPITCFQDLIDLANMFNANLDYNIDLLKIARIAPIVTKIISYTSFTHILEQIFTNIICYLFTKTPIAPGVIISGLSKSGKTSLANTIAELYILLNLSDKVTNFISINHLNIKSGVLIIDDAHMLDQYSIYCITKYIESNPAIIGIFVENTQGKTSILSTIKSISNTSAINFPWRYVMSEQTENNVYTIFQNKLNTIGYKLAPGINYDISIRVSELDEFIQASIIANKIRIMKDPAIIDIHVLNNDDLTAGMARLSKSIDDLTDTMDNLNISYIN